MTVARSIFRSIRSESNGHVYKDEGTETKSRMSD